MGLILYICHMNITKEEIVAFIEGEETEISIDFSKGWDQIQELLMPLGYGELEDDDFDDATNGWDVGFWYTWKHDTLANITVSGSLHTGGFKLNKE